MVNLQHGRLPGWEEFVAADPKIQPYLDRLGEQIEHAIRDEDSVRFGREFASVRNAWERVNERIAERYRAANPDPETWELRYVKWMNISYIRYDSPMGELYMVPRESSRKLRDVTWCTVDEMMTWLHPGIAGAIKLAGAWPTRDFQGRPPRSGEQVIRMDATGQTVKTTFELGKASRYG